MDNSNNILNNDIRESLLNVLFSGIQTNYTDGFASIGRTTSDLNPNNPNTQDVSGNTNNNLDNEYMDFFRTYLFSNIRAPRGRYGNSLENILQRSFIDPSQNLYKSVLSEEGETQIKKVKYEKNKFPNDSCPVTLYDFKEGDEVSQLPCGHIFQPEAVLKWLKDEKASCPVCRKPLASKEVKKKFTNPIRRRVRTVPLTNRRLNANDIFRNYINNQIRREEEAEMQAAIMASLRDQEN